MSLRARLLLVTVGLVAVGLLVANVATFTFTRAFLERRIDEQLTAARPFAAAALIDQGSFGSPPPGVAVPPGTYAEARNAEGEVVAVTTFGYQERAVPPLPPTLPPPDEGADDDPSTVAFTMRDEGTAWRALATTLAERRHARRGRAAHRDDRDTAPAARRRARGERHRARGRDRARPVARAPRAAAARRHGQHRRRDRRRRSLAARASRRAAHRGGAPGHGPQRHAVPDRGGLRTAQGQRGAAPSVRGRRVARAAHPAHVDPWIRGAVPARRGQPARGPRAIDGRGSRPRPPAWACWSTTCCCSLVSTKGVHSSASPWTSPTSPPRRSRQPARSSPIGT